MAKSFTPKDEEMEKTFEEILKAEKFLVITINKDGKGEYSRFHNDFPDKMEAVKQLRFWADMTEGRVQADAELKTILKEKGIGED